MLVLTERKGLIVSLHGNCYFTSPLPGWCHDCDPRRGVLQTVIVDPDLDKHLTFLAPHHSQGEVDVISSRLGFFPFPFPNLPLTENAISLSGHSVQIQRLRRFGNSDQLFANPPSHVFQVLYYTSALMLQTLSTVASLLTRFGAHARTVCDPISTGYTSRGAPANVFFTLWTKAVGSSFIMAP